MGTRLHADVPGIQLRPFRSPRMGGLRGARLDTRARGVLDRAMEKASFQFTDARAVIDASLACPHCLHAVTWEPAGSGAQPAIACQCRSCGRERTVETTGAQMLRLTMSD